MLFAVLIPVILNSEKHFTFKYHYTIIIPLNKYKKYSLSIKTSVFLFSSIFYSESLHYRSNLYFCRFWKVLEFHWRKKNHNAQRHYSWAHFCDHILRATFENYYTLVASNFRHETGFWFLLSSNSIAVWETMQKI